VRRQHQHAITYAITNAGIVIPAYVRKSKKGGAERRRVCQLPLHGNIDKNLDVLSLASSPALRTSRSPWSISPHDAIPANTFAGMTTGIE